MASRHYIYEQVDLACWKEFPGDPYYNYSQIICGPVEERTIDSEALVALRMLQFDVKRMINNAEFI